jgi:hypothetical protein
MRQTILYIAAGILLVAARSAEARVEGDALAAQPFGVGQVTISGLDVAIDINRVSIEEKNGRVHYPAVSQGVVGRLIGQLLGGPAERPAAGITVYFLFRGQEPLELTVYTPQPVSVVVQPRADNQRRLERDFTTWWRHYNAFWRNERADDNQSPIVATYLTTMLSQRFSLDAPLMERLQTKDNTNSQTTQALELMLGMERLRLETLRNTMLGRGDFGEVANLPLPAAPIWTPPALPAAAAAVEIEPMALHVPQGWFYVRFGTFPNYLWFDHLLDEYSGDIASMVTLRSYAPPDERQQEQLALESSVLGDLFGEHVIADVALVGRDTFGREGAALGMIFQAKNSRVLGKDFSDQRGRALARLKDKGATEQKLQIGGREVSFIATPDNRLRSFYVADGDFHLVTNCRAMVEQFVGIADGRGSIGTSPEFRLARQSLPLARNDTVFVYFSSAFFEGLFTPQYIVELSRRMKSVTDIELLMLARLAARGEQTSGERPEDLVAAGLLPRGFGRRPDGSGPVDLSEGGTPCKGVAGVSCQIIDSLRGARGTFTPVPDVPITAVTRGEAERLQSLSAQLASQWRRMDPLFIGIQRTALDDKGRERIVIDGNVNPLDEGKYGRYMSLLGPPTRQMVSTAQGDVVSAQASLRGGVLLPRIPPHHMFVGIQDLPRDTSVANPGLMQTLNLLRTTPGYVGSWPAAGFLDLLPFNLGGSAADANGFSRLPFGLWRRQGGGFSVLAFDPQLLADVTPQLRVVESEIEAQLRLHVQDLSQSKIKPWIQSVYYQRGLTASAGNARFLALLEQQLHVPLERARDTMQELVDAELLCPLGGKYELVEDLNGGLKSWQSTAWAKRNAQAVPEDFEAPLLKWFRGLDGHLAKFGDQVTTRIELDMQRNPAAPKVELPSFFNLGNLFGSGQKALKAKDKPNGEELPPPLPPVANPPKIELPKPAPGGRET